MSATDVKTKYLFYVQETSEGRLWVLDTAHNTVAPYDAIVKPIGSHCRLPLMPGIKLCFFETEQRDFDGTPHTRVLCLHTIDIPGLDAGVIPAGVGLPIYGVFDYSECGTSARSSDLDIVVGDLRYMRFTYQQAYLEQRAAQERIDRERAAAASTIATHPTVTAAPISTTEATKATEDAVKALANMAEMVNKLEKMLIEVQKEHEKKQDALTPAATTAPTTYTFGNFSPEDLKELSKASTAASTPPTPDTTRTTKSNTAMTAAPPKAVVFSTLQSKQSRVAAKQSLETALISFRKAVEWFDSRDPVEFIKEVAAICKEHSEFSDTGKLQAAFTESFNSERFEILLSCICDVKTYPLADQAALMDIYNAIFTRFLQLAPEVLKEKTGTNKEKLAKRCAVAWEDVVCRNFIPNDSQTYGQVKEFWDTQKAKIDAERKAAPVKADEKLDTAPPPPVLYVKESTRKGKERKEKEKEKIARKILEELAEEKVLAESAKQGKEAAAMAAATATAKQFQEIIDKIPKEKGATTSAFKQIKKLLDDIKNGVYTGVTINNLLNQTNGQRQTLLMLLLACPAATDNTYAELLRLVIKNSGQGILTPDNEGKNVLSYFSKSYFSALDAADVIKRKKEGSKGKKPHNALISEELFNAYFAAMKERLDYRPSFDSFDSPDSDAAVITALLNPLHKARNSEDFSVLKDNAMEFFNMLLAEYPAHAEELKNALCIKAASAFYHASSERILDFVKLLEETAKSINLEYKDFSGNNLLHLVLKQLAYDYNYHFDILKRKQPASLTPKIIYGTNTTAYNALICMFENPNTIASLLTIENSNNKSPLDCLEENVALRDLIIERLSKCGITLPGKSGPKAY